MDWNEASSRANTLLEGVVRGRVAASEPGVELAYLDWGGDGEVVTFLHANGFCGATLALIASALRDQYRVVAFDVRGHGDSTPVPAGENGEAYFWSRLAADYAAALPRMLDEIGRERIRFAIGHSFGGVLTLGAAAQLPGRVEEMILLDPVIFPPLQPGESETHSGNPLAEMSRRRRAVFPSAEAAFDHLGSRGLFKDFQPESLALYVSEAFADTESGEVQLKCDPSVEAAVFEGARSIDGFQIARELDVPTTILHASQGNFSRDVYDSFAALMPATQVQTCDGGHLFPMERPEIVLETIRVRSEAR